MFPSKVLFVWEFVQFIDFVGIFRFRTQRRCILIEEANKKWNVKVNKKFNKELKYDCFSLQIHTSLLHMRNVCASVIN